MYEALTDEKKKEKEIIPGVDQETPEAPWGWDGADNEKGGGGTGAGGE